MPRSTRSGSVRRALRGSQPNGSTARPAGLVAARPVRVPQQRLGESPSFSLPDGARAQGTRRFAIGRDGGARRHRGVWRAFVRPARSVGRRARVLWPGTRLLSILFDSSMVRVTNRGVRPDRRGTRHRLGGSRLDSALLATLRASDAGVSRALVCAPRRVVELGKLDRRTARRCSPSTRIPPSIRASRVFRSPWSATPVRVDVAAYTNWAGADATEHPSHINIKSTNTGNRHKMCSRRCFMRYCTRWRTPSSRRYARRFATGANDFSAIRRIMFIFYTSGSSRDALTLITFRSPNASDSGRATLDFERALPLLRGALAALPRRQDHARGVDAPFRRRVVKAYRRCGSSAIRQISHHSAASRARSARCRHFRC